MRDIHNFAAITRTLQCVALAGRVFKVVSRIFCSTSGVSARRERLRFFRLANAFGPTLGEGDPGCPNGRSGQAGSLRDRVVRQALACQQDYLAFAGCLLWRVTCPSHRFQLTFLDLVDLQSSSANKHTVLDHESDIVNT